MGVFDSLLTKTLSAIGSASEKINNSVNNKLKKNVEVSYDSANILYYRCYSVFKIYRAIFYKSGECKSERVKYDLEFDTLEELQEFFSQYNLNINYINVLSKDYIYVTKSGINTDSNSDFRLDKDILSDSVFFSIYSNDSTDDIDLVNERVGIDVYKPYIENKAKTNKAKWSYELIERYLQNGRIGVFLMSSNRISYDDNLDKIITNPKELLFDLVALSKTIQLHITHCGDLGIQITFK